MIKPMFILGAVLMLTACTQKTKVSAPKPAPTEKPITLMTRVAKQVQACWFAKKDPALNKYKMATELDSYSGQPRILIVPRNNPTGLPKLVAQASRKGSRNNFSTFGPLLATKDGPRLNADLRNWAQGSRKC